MRVVGTAGHVDHGKSSLIEALTGTHPDRLAEEQARQMTIDLGFGWLTLPDGSEVGIVDVPGHRDFIENMLAGITGIDAALLVIAADEGVMPQTREHLAIIDLLRIPAGIMVLTKIDLISDVDWLNGLESEVRNVARGTVLQDWPIVRVSARTHAGLGDLLTSLSAILTLQPERPDLGRPRLPIDRVFAMSGFGTVITGTLSDGHITNGDEVEFLPSGLRGRVRGLQTHRKKVERAVPGSRTAVNISGISAERLRRGEVMTHPDQYQTSRRLDARFRLLADASASLVHNREVKVFVGSSETLATLRLLGTDVLSAGQEGWIQLELRQPLVCVRGDRFVLRRPSPAETLGGGTIVDPQPSSRHKRFDNAVLESLRSLAAGDPAGVLYEAVHALHSASIRQAVTRSYLAAKQASLALQQLVEAGRLVVLEGDKPSIDNDLLVLALPDWTALQDRIARTVSAYHEKFPLRAGMPREELKSQLNLSARLFGAAVGTLVSAKALIGTETSVAQPDHTIRFDAEQQARVDTLMQQFERNPFSPPSIKECRVAAGEDIVGALIALGELVTVSEEFVFRKVDYDSMVAEVRAALQSRGQVTLAEVRDSFHTSRKYAQALLEHLDATGVTRRSGDSRILVA